MNHRNSGSEAALASELRTVVGKLKRRLREHTHLGGLSWSQTSALSRLDREGPATVTTLARADEMRPQSMGAIVAVLERSGFAVGNPNPEDGRQTILSITEAGRQWLDVRRAAGQDWLSQAIRSHLSPTEQAELSAAVRLLERLVATPAAEGVAQETMSEPNE